MVSEGIELPRLPGSADRAHGRAVLDCAILQL